MLRLKFHVTLDNRGQSYNYDAEGRITAAFWGKTLLAIYEYNSEGNLVYENGSNGIQVFQRDAEGRPVWTYTPPGASGPVSTTEIYADDWIGGWQDGTLVFAGKDWLGTKRYESFGQGSSISSVTPIYFHSYTSLPFGDNLSSFGQDATHFTGKERDVASGNDYFGARYYASTMGRWMSPDESLNGAIMELPQTWNKYSYEYNRPLYGTDPDGRCPPCIGAIIGGVVEGGISFGEQVYDHRSLNTGESGWKDVGASALGGAVAGAIAGATGGASLILDAAAGATGNIAGGIVTRAANGDNADQMLSAGAVADDAVSGFIGGGVEHVAGGFVHIPDEPTFHFNGRNGRYYNQAYRAGLRALRGRSTQAYIYQGVRAGLSSSAASHATGTFWNWAEQWFFNHSPQSAPQRNVTVTIISCQDMSGRPCQ